MTRRLEGLQDGPREGAKWRNDRNPTTRQLGSVTTALLKEAQAIAKAEQIYKKILTSTAGFDVKECTRAGGSDHPSEGVHVQHRKSQDRETHPDPPRLLHPDTGQQPGPNQWVLRPQVLKCLKEIRVRGRVVILLRVEEARLEVELGLEVRKAKILFSLSAQATRRGAGDVEVYGAV
ncbi:hypothetical protein PILCRDRAFT_89554 [Piloderma croceum F 1598]|uniref:Uncharacterized protein n=1 Tax=Piloderma croceum (strain F 1598) TaxID=765440 RepID=A0A0C3F7D8_PILCF|nr:hypothetical protein PILCRDRAFT_89554 [Piloderma croceum F 1598]